MDYSIELDYTTTNTPSSRSGHQPGTPKPPIDPPRRRSSLHFSKVFSCSPPIETASAERLSQDTPVSPRKRDYVASRTTPSNTGRRRMPPPAGAEVTPGHVAQMQRLFQSAKASLRVDMAFAASPTGSIGSRLPPTQQFPEIDRPAVTPTPSGTDQQWRYSTAPSILLGLDRDVREPVPEASPVLPELQPLDLGDSFAAEPLSSGFNSPADTQSHALSVAGIEYGSNPPANESPQFTQDGPSISEIQGKMTDLRVVGEGDRTDTDMDESPLVARVRRVSAAEVPLPASRPLSTTDVEDTMSTDVHVTEAAPHDEIFLSEPAKAAAESAKVKRGMLRSLFFHRATSKEAKDDQQPTQDPSHSPIPSSERADTPCPDPKLHELFSRTTCPDPAAHFTPIASAHAAPSITPEATTSLAQTTAVGRSQQTQMYALQPPMAHFQRASATGSPMAFPKFKSPPPSPPLMYVVRPPTRPGERPISPHPPHKALQRSDYPEMNSEHFQPGWYYTKEPPGPSSRMNPMMYSFSTAAAKSVGQSAAPDSRIRDSYRTDTLTPLSKPPSRYRKTSITAMASTRGVGKYYGNNISGPGPTTRTGTKKSRCQSGVQFRSSPPFQPTDMATGYNKRRRPRDLEDENVGVREEDSQVMELDDDTRAAIRMSLFGTETPQMLHVRESLRELSPNVVTSRKDERRRKKRRPSYWDGDLKEVQISPAARDDNGKVLMSGVRGSVRKGAERTVMTSPPKEGVESLKSQQVEIEGKENASVRHSMPEASFSYDVGDGDVLMNEDGDGTMLAIERDME